MASAETTIRNKKGVEEEKGKKKREKGKKKEKSSPQLNKQADREKSTWIFKGIRDTLVLAFEKQIWNAFQNIMTM